MGIFLNTYCIHFFLAISFHPSQYKYCKLTVGWGGDVSQVKREIGKYTKDDVISTLRRQILTMELEPGQPLDESRLTRLYGLSRTPLREVLRQLSGEGYTLIHENRGAFVSPMDHKSMRHFFLTAPMIYAATARLAARSSTSSHIDALARIQRDFKDAVERRDVDGMVYFNDRFHYQTGVISGNSYLMPSLQRLLIDHARIGQIFWQQKGDARDDRITTASAHHDRFIEVFAAGDEEEAVRLTLEHWELSRQYMDDYIHPRPLDFEISPFDENSAEATADIKTGT